MKKQTYSSVWDALEESPEAAANMRLRANLMIAVQRHVAAGGLTQATGYYFRVTFSDADGGRPSTGLFVSTDAKLGEEEEIFRDLER